jgi:hypothetical protein
MLNRKVQVGRVGLDQLVRFLVVELTHPGSNPRFDMGVAFTTNYSFSGRRHPRRQRGALGDELHAECAHRGRVCVCVFMDVDIHMDEPPPHASSLQRADLSTRRFQFFLH